MKKLYLLFLTIFYSILSQEIKPDISVTSKPQHGVTCTATCIVAAQRLMNTKLINIAQTDLCDIVDEGKTLYNNLFTIYNQNKSEYKYYLQSEYTSFSQYKTLGLTNNISCLNEFETINLDDQITNTIYELPTEIKKLATKYLANIYAIVTSKNHTTLIAYEPDSDQWAIFDSLRNNISGSKGCGLNIFNDENNFNKYLSQYFEKFADPKNINASIVIEKAKRKFIYRRLNPLALVIRL